jgi:hypothetical protein
VPADARLGFVLFSADGEFVGDDGGNRCSGRWAVDADGVLLLTPQLATTLILVRPPHADVHRLLADAAQVGFDGEELVVLGWDGEVTDRLRRGAVPSWAEAAR